MPKITKDEVRHLAKLSRLKLSEDEADDLTKDLEDILSYIDILNEVDTSQIEGSSHVIPGGTMARADEEKSVFTKDDKTPAHRLQEESPEKIKNSLYKAPSSHEK